VTAAPATVDDLLALLARGDRAFDEPALDALAHALQCGALLHAEYPDDSELAVAGLVHDISDMADPASHRDHEGRGARLVAPLLGARVARLVGAHVVAKRYLVATDPSYGAGLSDRSTETLADQGGPLDEAELLRLRADPDLDSILALRRADERAKVPGARVPGLDTWRPLLVYIARG
jgi:predicted HD phosphohydrolase